MAGPVYRVSMGSGVSRRVFGARAAYRAAHARARQLRRCGLGWTVQVTRVYDGDNAAYRYNPITRYVASDGAVL